ncbi:Dabb family protein [Sphaerisporangium sp. NPDC051017]|uniref:Dabb family protein n=1 Tax=Sphaerisporangium sp. NPDC051017 TaxID=3154636 RepID=UPI003424A83F
MSFTHIVLFTWSSEAERHNQTVAKALREFTPGLEGVVSYRCGGDAGVTDTNADFAIVADFASREAFEAYRDHPEHQRILREEIAPHLKSKSVAQWWVTGTEAT